MSDRSAPPFRADHVGSLLRPPELRRARDDFAAGRISAEQLRRWEDRAIREAVRMQEDVGLSSATDGEFRRGSWHVDFISRLDGVTLGEDVRRLPAYNERGTVEYAANVLRITGRIGLGETIFGDDFAFLEAATTSATPKLTIPSPSMLIARAGREPLPNAVYRDVEEFAGDVTAAYAEEVRRLAELGCTYLQLDDTTLAFLNDPVLRARMAPEGHDPDHAHEFNIRNINRALASRPAGLTVTVHLCRGNFRSSWFSEGGYDFVAEALFSELEVDGFFLEYDDARSGSFEPLRFVPPDKLVVLGLVTTKRGALEAGDALKRRVEAASRYVPLERLCISPQCGFASTLEGNALSLDEERAKLALVVETAAEIWG
ncbi:MAG TPA: 5-methyltetrahydropteroyltriglutamate--homocysteine S-methyltransferase [Candidatus Dormibacteraeota bacterium]|nr:5-methyltetrahydropteroyltriglutamate--homocysteine S-methyltransferase [Candidatus Dormibacteraeota bacterium]